MRQMGIAALGPKPRTSRPAPGHKVHPYLLRDLVIDRPNQVWAADITYLPIGRGFLYLVAIMDWASRAVLSCRLYNSQRPHQSLGHRTPMEVWREGVTGCLDGKAVDMTRRLDNAGALTTCPQPQQPKMMIA